MSNITYLLGAGASYGERNKNGDITRGVPIVSEFSKSINSIKGSLTYTYNKRTTTEKTKGQIDKIREELNWLSERCAEYPTIDTYARMLYVTKNHHLYERLKNVLSVFLLLAQKNKNHDLRYDGFIASLIDDEKHFPPINILSWNYDAQFEMAYADYASNGKYILNQWEELNVMNKTIEAWKVSNDSCFSIIKLNGTAFFVKKIEIIDPFYGGYKDDDSFYENMFNCLTQDIYKNTLSYAWEEDESFIKKAITKTEHTDILVVIGYSFPYVNRSIDRKLLQSMKNLKTIYIQNPNASEIKESIEATLLQEQCNNVEFIFKDKNLSQFFIPARL